MGGSSDTVSGRRQSDVAVDMITRNRRADIVRSLEALDTLPERPDVIVVDNASADGTPALVKEAFPQIRVMEMSRNLGAAARNVGVGLARAPYVAFSDDDSWWAPGSLTTAVEIFEAHPHVGLIAGKILVGNDGTIDPTSRLMAESPLYDAALPGPSIVGFVACGSIVRRDAFLDAGGFWTPLGIGAEEELLALELRQAGWRLAYVAEIVAHHHPSPVRDVAKRNQLQARNRLWIAWKKRRLSEAIARTINTAWIAVFDQDTRRGLLHAAQAAFPVLRERRPVGRALERELRLVNSVAGSWAAQGNVRTHRLKPATADERAAVESPLRPPIGIRPGR